MPTLTTNYEFQLPVEGADDDVWGGFLNANWTALDTRLFSGTIGADTTGNAATATSATSATSATLAADATKLETARTLTIGGTGKTFDGSANVTWTLGEVGVTLASQVEAEAGTDNTKFMTPLRTAEAIAALAPAPAELSEAQATDDISTVFGQVSGQRLSQAVAEFAEPLGAALYTSSNASWYGAWTKRAHDLGRNPRMVQYTLRCTTANNGYAVGDRITLGSGASWQDSWRGVHAYYNTTEVGVYLSNITIRNKTTGAGTQLSASTNWTLEIEVW